MTDGIPLAEFAVRIAAGGLERQSSSGAMPPGHNGPYHDPETPVRNTGHWLFLFARAQAETGAPAFRRAVQKAAAYLAGEDARPAGQTFRHRSKGDKDACNGLIGQAWSIEALTEASVRLEDTALMAIAADVFLRHPFQEQRGVWESVEVDGKVLGVDPTFNHQLWFAAAGSLIEGPHAPVIRARVGRFLDRLPHTLQVLDDGLIYHPLTVQSKPLVYLHRGLKKVYSSARRMRRSSRAERRAQLLSKSVGYHAFCTYAFAVLRQRLPSHGFWTSEQAQRLTGYLLSDGYRTAILAEPTYGFSYNPPGFEVPFSISVLARLKPEVLLREAQWWLSEQITRCYDSTSGQLRWGTEDPATLTARVYETVRFPPPLWTGLKVPSGIEPAVSRRSGSQGRG